MDVEAQIARNDVIIHSLRGELQQLSGSCSQIETGYDRDWAVRTPPSACKVPKVVAQQMSEPATSRFYPPSFQSDGGLEEQSRFYPHSFQSDGGLEGQSR